MRDDAPEVEVEDEIEPEPVEDERFDEEFRARRAAALAHVRKWGDPVLKSRARAVDRFDDALQAEVDYMRGIMHDAYGVGLAAPQVGTSNRVLVYRVQPESPIIALVNPEVEWMGKETEVVEEGCLSLPNVHVDVERPVHVRARAVDEHGEPHDHRGLGPRGAGDPARDRPPRRRADDRALPARPAQGGDPHPARAGLARGVTVGGRSPTTPAESPRSRSAPGASPTPGCAELRYRVALSTG